MESSLILCAADLNWLQERKELTAQSLSIPTSICRDPKRFQNCVKAKQIEQDKVLASLPRSHPMKQWLRSAWKYCHLVNEAPGFNIEPGPNEAMLNIVSRLVELGDDICAATAYRYEEVKFLMATNSNEYSGPVLHLWRSLRVVPTEEAGQFEVTPENWWSYELHPSDAQLRPIRLCAPVPMTLYELTDDEENGVVLNRRTNPPQYTAEILLDDLQRHIPEQFRGFQHERWLFIGVRPAGEADSQRLTFQQRTPPQILLDKYERKMMQQQKPCTVRRGLCARKTTNIFAFRAHRLFHLITLVGLQAHTQGAGGDDTYFTARVPGLFYDCLHRLVLHDVWRRILGRISSRKRFSHIVELELQISAPLRQLCEGWTDEPDVERLTGELQGALDTAHFTALPAAILIKSVQRLYPLLDDLCRCLFHLFRQAARYDAGWDDERFAFTTLRRHVLSLRSTANADEHARDLVDHPLLKFVGEDLPDRVHAEMRIVDYFMRRLPAAQTLPISLPYIGISKPCCVHCYSFLRVICTNISRTVCGKHCKPFTWQLPPGWRQDMRFLRAFSATDPGMLQQFEWMLLQDQHGPSIRYGGLTVTSLEFALDVLEYGWHVTDNRWRARRTALDLLSDTSDDAASPRWTHELGHGWNEIISTFPRTLDHLIKLFLRTA